MLSVSVRPGVDKIVNLNAEMKIRRENRNDWTQVALVLLIPLQIAHHLGSNPDHRGQRQSANCLSCGRRTDGFHVYGCQELFESGVPTFI
jgi:hypothetical protein